MTEPNPPRQDDKPPNVAFSRVSVESELEALALTYGRGFSQGVLHSCALLTFNALAHALLREAHAAGRLSDADVAAAKDELAQAGADASSVVFAALCQERSAVDILQTAQELRQRVLAAQQFPAGFRPV